MLAFKHGGRRAKEAVVAFTPSTSELSQSLRDLDPTRLGSVYVHRNGLAAFA